MSGYFAIIMDRFFLIIFIAFLSISGCYCQQEILSISSFRACVDVDTRLGQSNYNTNVTNINCGPPGTTQPPITVLNLLFSPNAGSAANFTFNLTIVAGSANSISNSTSTDGTICQSSNPQFDLCTLTTPAVINIKSTRLSYKYRLNLQQSNIIPYCYASTSLFETYKNISHICGTTQIPVGCSVDNKGVFSCDTSEADACIPIQNTKPVTSTISKLKINQMAGSALTDPFKLSSFERVQQPFFPTSVSCTNFNNLPVYWNSHASHAGGAGQSAFNWVFQQQGNLQGWYDPNNQGFFFKDPPPNSNAQYCRLYQDLNYNDLYYDSPNLDIRIPTVYPQPSIFGLTPSPVYRNLVTDPINGNPNLIIPPVNITSFNFITGSISFSCAGFGCAANQDERRKVLNQLNEGSGGFAAQYTNAQFATGVHSIIGLAPYCAVYEITSIPEVFAEIDIEVIINPDQPNESIETLTITNLNPSSSKRSLPSGYVYGQVESIKSSNFIIGPAIQGSIIICGQDYEQFTNNFNSQNPGNTFPNMQCLIPGVVCDNTQSVDLADSPGFSEATNPWPTIINQSQSQPGMEKRTNFYPHPYDYMIPNLATNGKDPSFTYLPNDHGQTFWYFVDSTTYATQFGKSCNQIGLAVGGNSIQQNSNLWCNIDPHECLPGLGQTINGGLKNALPCIVSQYFNMASGLYDGINLPFPYGTAGLKPADLPFYNFNSSTYINQMKSNAGDFVPFNPFISDKTNAPLYDPKNPQFWLGKEGGTGAPYLYYLPTATTNGVTESLTSVGINLVLNVAGNFVQYSVAVAKGEIVIDKSNCTINQGQSATTYIFVQNPSQTTTTNYIISLNCNPDPIFNNSIILSVPDNNQFLSLPPNTGVYVNFTVTAPENEPVTNELLCIVTMSYADVATAISDQQELNCGYQITSVPPHFQSGLPTPPNTPPIKYANYTCSGFCALSCRAAQGIIYEDGCFWIMIIALSAVTIAVIGSISEIIALRVKFNVIKSTSKQEGDKFIKEQIAQE